MIVIDLAVMSQAYEIRVADDAQCSALSATRLRCAYRLKFLSRLTMMGVTTPTFDANWISRRDDFDLVGGQLVSSTLDVWMNDTVGQPSPAGGGRPVEPGRNASREEYELRQAFREADRLTGCNGFGNCRR